MECRTPLVSSLRFDHQNKARWVPGLEKARIIKKVRAGTYIFSETYSAPWPSSDVMFVLKGSITAPERGVYQMVASSDYSAGSSLTDGYIVPDVHELKILVKETHVGRSKVAFVFRGSFDVWMPAWLNRMIVGHWPVEFLKGLRSHVTRSDGITTSSIRRRSGSVTAFSHKQS